MKYSAIVGFAMTIVFASNRLGAAEPAATEGGGAAAPLAKRFDESAVPSEAEVTRAEAERIEARKRHTTVQKEAAERAEAESGYKAARIEVAAAVRATGSDWPPSKSQSAPPGWKPPTAEQTARIKAAQAAEIAAREKFQKLHAADEALIEVARLDREANERHAKLSNALRRAKQRKQFADDGFAPLTAKDLADAPDGKAVALLDCTFDGVDSLDRQKIPAHGWVNKRPTLVREKTAAAVGCKLRDADGGRYAHVYLDRDGESQASTVPPGTAMDVYGWVVKLEDGTVGVKVLNSVRGYGPMIRREFKPIPR